MERKPATITLSRVPAFEIYMIEENIDHVKLLEHLVAKNMWKPSTCVDLYAADCKGMTFAPSC